MLQNHLTHKLHLKSPGRSCCCNQMEEDSICKLKEHEEAISNTVQQLQTENMKENVD